MDTDPAHTTPDTESVGDGELTSASTESVTPNAWWSVAGITILFWGFALYSSVDSHPWVIVLVICCGLWGLATVAAGFVTVHIDRRLAATAAGATLALALGAFFVWSYLQVLAAPGYGTDEAAFDQYAAQLLVHGLNPYVHSMGPSLGLFHVSPNGFTFGLNGQPITHLSYPALSFLLYAPVVALGATTQVAIEYNVIAWGLGMVLLFVLLPRRLRPLAIVVSSFSVYVGYAVGGVTDALFVPFMIGAMYRWDEFPLRRGIAAWRGPLLLGLAMAIKQTPWLVLPFIAVAVGLEARDRPQGRPWATSGRYLAIAIGAFLVPNLFFIAADPSAWWSGTLTPLLSHAVPAGQGYVGLSLFLGVGGGSLDAYSLALLVVAVSLLALFAVTYPALKRTAILIPAVVLFFSARSFGSYLVTLLPGAIIGAYTVGRMPSPSTASRQARRLSFSVLLAGGGASLLALVAVLVARPPLEVQVNSVRTTGQLATVVQLGVEATNTSSSGLRPAFTVESGGAISAFWRFDGPKTIPAHSSAHYELFAPNFFAQPSVGGGFQVVAFTSAPATVSRSAAYLPTTWHVALSPDAVNTPIKVGRPVVLHAEVLNNVNQLVDTSGQPVYLGQVIYSQQGLQYSEAKINSSQVGQTPVAAYTKNGVATFVVRGTVATNDPVYFEANLINPTQFYPYGYSEIVPIRFVK